MQNSHETLNEFTLFASEIDHEPPLMTRVPKGYKPKILAEFEKKLQDRVEELMTWRRTYQKEGYGFPERWGYMLYTGLIQSVSEYILSRKALGNPCSLPEVQRLRSSLETGSGADLYLKGAKLGLILESQDPLSDAELFYLCQEETSVPNNFLNQSYSDRLFETLLRSIEAQFTKQKRKQRVLQVGAGAASFTLVLALRWIGYSL